MTEFSTAHEDAAQSASQPVLVSILSIAVIAATAVLFKWLTVPTEVTTPLAMASGAAVPTVAMRLRESKKAKADHIEDLTAGRDERPGVYVLIIAAGLLALAEWISYLVFGFALGFGVGLASTDGGTLTDDQASELVTSDAIGAVVVLLGLLTLMATAGPIGTYVGHRICRNPLLWALGAILLSQAVSLVLEVALGQVNYLAYLVWPLALVLPVWLGVRRGKKTRALFRATRLFKRLHEADRAAVLAMMAEAQLPRRLSERQASSVSL